MVEIFHSLLLIVLHLPGWSRMVTVVGDLEREIATIDPQASVYETGPFFHAFEPISRETRLRDQRHAP